MDNYLVVNGIKIEFTEKQLKALGIETNAFSRKSNQLYYFIDEYGDVVTHHDNTNWDAAQYNVANYCTDEALMKKRALHETLNRLLWRFSMENDGDKIDWNDYSQQKYFIYFDAYLECNINWDGLCRMGAVYFYTREIAEQAINEVVKPFIEKHPEFKC